MARIGLEGLDLRGQKPSQVRRVLVSRSLLRVRVLPLQALPLKDQLPSLRVQALAWQPFDRPRLLLALRAGFGLAVAWDDVRVSEHLRAAGCDLQRVALIPELQLQQPLQQGWRLVQGFEGFEGQFWLQGLLRASRWWAALPTDAQWLEFERQAGDAAQAAEPVAAPPAAQTVSTAVPWIELQAAGDAVATGAAPIERIALWTGSALFVVATAALARQGWEARSQLQAQADERQALQLRSAPTLAARDQALQAGAEARGLALALQAPQPLEVMQHLAQRLPPGVLLKDFELTGRSVKLLLDVPATVPRSTLVRELQAGGWLQDVREAKANAGSVGLALEMTLGGLQPQPLATAAPATAAPSAAAPTVPAAVAPAPAQTAAPPTPGFPLPAAAQPAQAAPTAPPPGDFPFPPAPRPRSPS